MVDAQVFILGHSQQAAISPVDLAVVHTPSEWEIAANPKVDEMYSTNNLLRFGKHWRVVGARSVPPLDQALLDGLLD